MYQVLHNGYETYNLQMSQLSSTQAIMSR